jgi:predicted ester cyclase
MAAGKKEQIPTVNLNGVVCYTYRILLYLEYNQFENQNMKTKSPEGLNDGTHEMNKVHQIRVVVDQLIGQGNFEVVDMVFSQNYIAHAGDKTYKGQKFIRQFTKQVRTAIPDIKISKIEFLSHSENIISWQRTFCGTHKAALRGIPASLKKVKWTEMVVTRFDGNKIAEEWVVSDLAFQLMLKQPTAIIGRIGSK